MYQMPEVKKKIERNSEKTKKEGSYMASSA